MKRFLSIMMCLVLLVTLCPGVQASYSTSDDQAIADPFLYVIPNFQASVLYAYFIDSNGVASVPWPGEMMRRINGTYEVVLPPDTVGIVIQTGDEGLVYQSGRLTITPNVDVWVTVSGGGETISYQKPSKVPVPTEPTEPTIPPTEPTEPTISTDPTRPTASIQPQGQPSEYRVVGNADFLGSWDPANDQGVMTEVAPGVYKKVYENTPPGDYEILISKDGCWEQYWGFEDGSNFLFTVTEKTTMTVTFTLKDRQGVIDVKGVGSFGTDEDEPEPTEPTEPPTTEPLPTEPPSTEPLPTEPTEEVTIPQDTEQATNPTVPSSAAAAEPDVNEPVDADSADAPLSQPTIFFFNLLFIGIVCVMLYLLFLVRKRRKEQAAMILGGTIVQAGALSRKETENLVKDNPVQPSAQLDEAVMKAIKDIDETK